jgi:hypothetical protein
MKFFPMTCDRFHFWTPLVIGPLMLIPILGSRHLPVPGSLISTGVLAFVVLMLGVTTLMAPRGFRVSYGELVLERLAWPSFRVPMSDVVSVERGPEVKRGSGVRRVAGVGGWFWSGGLFSARGIGNVRAWMTRLGPTVVLRRREGLPILLGVDDVEGLLAALNQRGIKGP